MKTIRLLPIGLCLFAIYYSLFIIHYAYGATPTPIPGEVGVKAEVKSPDSAATESGSADVSTASALESQKEQPGAEDKKDQSPLNNLQIAQVQEGLESDTKEGLAEQALNLANNLLIKDNSWVRTLAILWVIFSFVVALLVLRRRSMQKEALQKPGNTNQATTAGAAPESPAVRTSDTEASS